MTAPSHVYRQRLFAKEFFVDCDSTAAVQRAGFKAKTQSALSSVACRLLASTDVQGYLREAFDALQARLDLQQDRAMLEICRLAYSDLRHVARWGPWGMELAESADLPEDVTSGIQDVTSTRKTRTSIAANGNPVEETEVRTTVKLHPKATALRMLQEFFRRGDPLSAAAEAKVNALILIMAQYVDKERLSAFRAHVWNAFGIEVPEGDGPPGPIEQLSTRDSSYGDGSHGTRGNGSA